MYKIGILQLTQNLDDAVHGFKNGLQQCGIAAEFSYKNADGNEELLPQLAKQLAAEGADLIFACSTPAALTAIALSGDIPVVFTPVFDPVGSRLVNSLDLPGGKATGVAGMVPAAAKHDFFTRLMPQARRIGILYHSADNNALTEVAAFRALHSERFTFAEIPVPHAEALSALPDLLPPDLDALFLPIGRVIEDNFPTIAYYTDSLCLPVIASHPPNVSAGAIGALTASHYQLGQECAGKAKLILQGTPAAKIPVDVVQQPEIILNAFAAANFGLTLSDELLAQAAEVFE